MQKVMLWCMKRIKWFLAIILLLTFIAFGNNKAGFFVDEYFSFLNANLRPDELDAIKESGINTYSGKELINICLISKSEERFNYREVWKNQEVDTHPPLYYAILHTVCSFTMTHLDMMTIGIGVNIVIALLTYFVLVKLINIFVENESVAAVYAFLYGISFSFINCFLFVRMYLLLTFFTILFLYLLCSYIEQEQYPAMFYIKLFAIICAGMLTQYYFGIYLAFSCMTVLPYLLYKKQYKNLLIGMVTVLCAIFCFYLIFPKGMNHIFSGDRGTQAINNAMTSNLLKNIRSMFRIVNAQVFGNCVYLIGTIILLLFVISIYNCKKNNKKLNISINYALMLIPSLLSFVLISKIAAYITDRYIMALMPGMFLGSFLFMRLLLRTLWKNPKSDVLIWAVMMLCVLMAYRSPIPFMIDADKVNRAQINQLDNDTKCIYLYDEGREWAAQCNLFQMENLNEITFLPHTDYLYYCTDFSKYDTLLLYNAMDISNDEANNIAENAAKIGQYTECCHLFNSGYSNTYILKR